MEVEDNEAMEIALIENLQRKDLDLFEEADGLQALADIHSYNHEQISAKIGKARSTITEILSIAKIPAAGPRDHPRGRRVRPLDDRGDRQAEDGSGNDPLHPGHRGSASDPRRYARPGQIPQGQNQEAQVLRLQFRP
ncbi:MAG: hypothetical protein MZV70_18370 [Desulfobacterales bacterium]|nr:hypothetical protein [Desulfobacterales bacterium]